MDDPGIQSELAQYVSMLFLPLVGRGFGRCLSLIIVAGDAYRNLTVTERQETVFLAPVDRR